MAELEKGVVSIDNGTGNVFEDLGLPSSDTDLLKIEIAAAITATIQRRELTQDEAAKITGTDQAKISGIVRGRVKGFSVERLMTFLVLLGQDIDIRISKKTKKSRGRIRIREAA
jgi:predicted XRE-type DNA-binding protein